MFRRGQYVAGMTAEAVGNADEGHREDHEQGAEGDGCESLYEVHFVSLKVGAMRRWLAG